MIQYKITATCETESDAHCLVKARSMAIALYDVHEQLFRPAFKHGYSPRYFPEIADKTILDIETWTGREHDLVSALSNLYQQLLLQHGISMDDLMGE